MIFYWGSGDRSHPLALGSSRSGGSRDLTRFARAKPSGDRSTAASAWRAIRWMVVRRSPSIDAGEAQFKARASIGWMVQTPPTGVSNNPRAFEQALSRSRAKAGICTTARTPRQWARPQTSGANKSPRGFCKPGGPFRHRGLVGLNLRRPTGLRATLPGGTSYICELPRARSHSSTLPAEGRHTH